MENKGYDYVVLVTIKHDFKFSGEYEMTVGVAGWPEIDKVEEEFKDKLLYKEADYINDIFIKEMYNSDSLIPAGNYDFRMHSAWSFEEKTNKIKGFIFNNIKV
jgi:hypothetical protein